MVCERGIKLGYVVLRRQGGFKWGFELPVDNIRPVNVLETDSTLFDYLIFYKFHAKSIKKNIGRLNFFFAFSSKNFDKISSHYMKKAKKKKSKNS